MDALMGAFQNLDKPDWTHLKLVGSVLDLETARFINSGELQAGTDLDGALSNLHQGGVFIGDPVSMWFYRRRSVRLTDNTTPPMFVLRFRAFQVYEHLSELQFDGPKLDVSFRSQLSDGSASQIGLDENFEDDVAHARAMGLLPYEAQMLRSSSVLHSGVPKDISYEPAFLQKQFEMIFPK